jgi:hypothetical protein
LNLQTVAVLRRFLTLATEGQPPSLEELARALDELAMTVHDTPEGDPADSDADPPEGDYSTMYARLSARFPEFGVYPSVDPGEAVGAQPVVGDAIDDLADIVEEIEEICWRRSAGGSTTSGRGTPPGTCTCCTAATGAATSATSAPTSTRSSSGDARVLVLPLL